MQTLHIILSICVLALIIFRHIQRNKIKSKPSVMNIDGLSKVSNMLSEDEFWSLIRKSLTETDSQEEQRNALIEQIGTLTPEEMIGFRLRTDKLLYDTYNSEMWCAGYIMNGGCSDDSFEYFRLWVISRGKDVYYAAKSNPDTLIKEVSEDRESYDFEDFWYVAIEAFKNKTGKDLYDYIDYDNFVTREGKYPQFDFTWKEEDSESIKKICPKLFERFKKS